MKRRTGICILICILVIFLSGGVYLLFFQEETPIEIQNSEIESQEIAQQSALNQEYYAYIIFGRDGRLSVYYGDNVTLYMETGIQIDSLPEEIKKNLDSGIRFSSQEELFDFLESYSS